MRAFVAIPVGPAVRQGAAELIERLRGPDDGVSWVRPENLHLTLRFLGEIDPPEAGRCVAQLVRALREGPAPFTVEFKGLGVFPEEGPPRVIWAGVARGREELYRLERVVQAGLGAARIPPPDRPFKAHLTLGRARRPADTTGLLRRLAAYREVFLGWERVETVVLYESRLMPGGPRYRPHARISLPERTEEG